MQVYGAKSGVHRVSWPSRLSSGRKAFQ